MRRAERAGQQRASIQLWPGLDTAALAAGRGVVQPSPPLLQKGLEGSRPTEPPPQSPGAGSRPCAGLSAQHPGLASPGPLGCPLEAPLPCWSQPWSSAPSSGCPPPSYLSVGTETSSQNAGWRTRLPSWPRDTEDLLGYDGARLGWAGPGWQPRGDRRVFLASVRIGGGVVASRGRREERGDSSSLSVLSE